MPGQRFQSSSLYHFKAQLEAPACRGTKWRSTVRNKAKRQPSSVTLRQPHMMHVTEPTNSVETTDPITKPLATNNGGAARVAQMCSSSPPPTHPNTHPNHHNGMVTGENASDTQGENRNKYARDTCLRRTAAVRDATKMEAAYQHITLALCDQSTPPPQPPGHHHPPTKLY